MKVVPTKKSGRCAQSTEHRAQSTEHHSNEHKHEHQNEDKQTAMQRKSGLQLRAWCTRCGCAQGVRRAWVALLSTKKELLPRSVRGREREGGSPRPKNLSGGAEKKRENQPRTAEIAVHNCIACGDASKSAVWSARVYWPVLTQYRVIPITDLLKCALFLVPSATKNMEHGCRQ